MLALVILPLLLLPTLSQAAQPNHCQIERLTTNQETVALSDKITGSKGLGYWFTGNATIEDPTFKLSAKRIFNHPSQQRYKALNDVYLGTDKLRLWGASATFQTDTSATLHHGILSTCTGSKSQLAWSVKASKLIYDQKQQNVSAYHATLKFFNVPIFYSPYINVSLVRRSGLLPPSGGYYQFKPPGSNEFSRSEFIAMGLYLNLASNYDAFIYPTWLEHRGIHTEGKIRYLTHESSGEFEFGILPNDPVLDSLALKDKNLYRLGWDNKTQLGKHTQINSNISFYSPRTYYNYLPRINGRGISPSSEDRAITLSHNPGKHSLSIQAKDTISLLNKTQDGYQLVPQINYAYPLFSGNNQRVNLTAQFTEFRSPELRTSPLTEGQRLVLNPVWRYEKSFPNLHVSSMLGAFINEYNLSKPDAHANTRYHFANFYSQQGIDLYFNNTPLFMANHWKTTLIPSVQYIYVPYVDHSKVPNFDSGLYRISQLQQLYNPREYSGYDRINEANRSVVSLSQEAFHFESDLFLQASLGRNLDIIKPQNERSNTAIFEDWFVQGKADLGAFHFSLQSQWDEPLSEHHYWAANALYEAEALTWRLNALNDQSSAVPTNYASLGVDSSIGRHWRMGLLANYDIASEYVQRYALGASYDDCCWQANITVDGTNTINERFEVYQVKLELIFKGLIALGYKGARSELFNLSQGF